MFVKNIYIRLGANVLNAAIGFVPFIFIIKIFGSEVVGNIAYYCSVAGAISLFADLGLSTAYNKFLAATDDPRDISTFLFLKIILILIYVLIFFATYILKFKNDDINSTLLFIGFAAILCDLVGQLFTSTMVGKRDFVFLSRVEIVAAVFLCVYNLFICFVIPNMYLLAANMILFRLVIISGGIVYFYKYRLLKLCRLEWQPVKKYVNYALPIAFLSVAGRLTSHIDKVLLGRFVGMGELGLYQIAFRCYSIIDKLIKPVTSTMFTEIVHRIANVPRFFHKKFRDLIQILNFLAGSLTLILIFVSTPLITKFFGHDNIRSSFILKFLALSIIGRLFWRPYTQVIFAIEKHKLIMYLQPLGMLVTVACYFLLIPMKVGDIDIGAAALPITEFIVWFFPAGLLRIWILKKEYGNIHMLETIFKIWLPMAGLVTIGWFFNYSILTFVSAAVSYLIIEYYLGVLTKARWDYLLEPVKSVFSKS